MFVSLSGRIFENPSLKEGRVRFRVCLILSLLWFVKATVSFEAEVFNESTMLVFGSEEFPLAVESGFSCDSIASYTGDEGQRDRGQDRETVNPTREDIHTYIYICRRLEKVDQTDS